jgi:GNAT superfamily N-acetyltransferase
MRIRRCTPEDAEALALVGAATFLQTFAGVLDGAAIVAHCASAHGAERYRALFAEGFALWLAEAEPGAAPVGYAMVGPSTLTQAGPNDIELKRIYVLDRFHGQGVGPALLATALQLARAGHHPRLLVGAYAGNAQAQAFYLKNGFRRLGERRFQVGAQSYEDHVFGLDLA